MDKIKYHIQKKNRREARKQTFVDFLVALVIAIVLTPIVIFLLMGIM